MLLLRIIWDPFTTQNLLGKEKKKVNVLGGSSVKSRGQKTSGMARSRHSKMSTQVHVDKAQRGQTNWTVSFSYWSRERWFTPEKPELPQGFWANHFFKNQVREGSRQAPNSPPDWRCGGRWGQRGQQSLGSRRSGAPVQGLHRVSIIYLLERRRRFTSAKQLRKSASHAIVYVL